MLCFLESVCRMKRKVKRWKEVVEKNMLVRCLKKKGMHKNALYGGLAAKTGSTRLAGKTSRAPEG